jgi:hypothetical protein
VIPLPVPVMPNEEQHSTEGESAVIEATNELLSIIEEFNNSENESCLYDEDEEDEIQIIDYKPGVEFDYSKVKVKIEPID